MPFKLHDSTVLRIRGCICPASSMADLTQNISPQRGHISERILGMGVLKDIRESFDGFCTAIYNGVTVVSKLRSMVRHSNMYRERRLTRTLRRHTGGASGALNRLHVLLGAAKNPHKEVWRGAAHEGPEERTHCRSTYQIYKLPTRQKAAYHGCTGKVYVE